MLIRSYFRSRGSTKRSRRNPDGDTSSPAVSAGNLQAAGVALLLLLAASRQIWWMVEQPRGSLLQESRLLKRVFHMLRTFRKPFNMGSFGSATKKPTWIYSSQGLIGLSNSFSKNHAGMMFLICKLNVQIR